MSAQSRPLLITRPLTQANAFVRLLNSAHPGRWAPVVAPLLKIVPVQTAIVPGTFKTLIFTSARAVEAAAGMPDLLKQPAVCAGPATFQAAQVAGFSAEQLADTSTALVASLLGLGARAPFLHLCGRHVTTDIAAQLQSQGIAATRHVVYDQIALPLDPETRNAIAAGEIRDVTFFSARTARIFAKQFPDTSPNMNAYCLSEAIGAALNMPDAQLKIAQTPDVDGILSIL